MISDNKTCADLLKEFDDELHTITTEIDKFYHASKDKDDAFRQLNLQFFEQINTFKAKVLMVTLYNSPSNQLREQDKECNEKLREKVDYLEGYIYALTSL